MANLIGVVTESGFGKSTSIGENKELNIEGLIPKETVIVNVKGKALPFRGWKKQYSIGISSGGNYVAIADAQEIIKITEYINNNRLEIKNLVYDDFQYIMAEQFMNDALKSGYDKFSRLGKNIYDLLKVASNCREDLNVFVLTHSDEKKVGNEETYKMKTIGKMLDEKVTLEGLFTILLYGKQSFDTTEKKVTKQFVTNYDGQYPAKSPYGMFTDLYIPNDLGYVARKIKEYNEGE
jgi:hypothetical protein